MVSSRKEGRPLPKVSQLITDSYLYSTQDVLILGWEAGNWACSMPSFNASTDSSRVEHKVLYISTYVEVRKSSTEHGLVTTNLTAFTRAACRIL